MANYYVNKNAQSNGDHEVHMNSCSRMPNAINCIYLGNFDSCAPAVKEAKKLFTKADGCFYCSPSCNTG